MDFCLKLSLCLVLLTFAACQQGCRVQPSKVAVLAANAQTELYVLDTGHVPLRREWPQILLAAPAGATDWNGPYAREAPRDPWGRALRYAYIAGTEPTFGIYSAGRNGMDEHGRGDDVTSWSDAEGDRHTRDVWHSPWLAFWLFWALLAIALILARL